jgi:hypothetical protein
LKANIWQVRTNEQIGEGQSHETKKYQLLALDSTHVWPERTRQRSPVVLLIAAVFGSP